MRTREGVLDERLGVLRLSDADLELAKLGFDEASPWPTALPSSREQRTDLSKREARVLAEPDQCQALGARDAVLPSSAGPASRREQPDALVVPERRARQPAPAGQFTDHGETSLM